MKENVFSINSSEDDKKEAEEKVAEREETPEYVVERRQEFWSPFSVTAEKDEPKSTNTTGWTISNARSAVETVIGAPEEVKEETSAYVKTEDELPAYESRIESFYSTATPVTASHIVADEQESFKPLWNTTGGTVQRVIDSFGDKNESVVKAENIDMVVPAEEPIVEEILGEEPDENVAETVAVESETVVAQEETTVEEVQEAAEEETAVEEAQEATEEETAVEEAQEAAEEETAEEVQEAAEEETAVEEVQEAAEATVEEKAANPYEFWDEDDDDDFFTEVTMDAVVEENEEAADSVVMAEDSVEEIVDVKAEADDFVEEDTETEAEADDFVVENVEAEAEADDFVVENVETEAEADDFVVENIETEAEADDFVVENVETEAEADDFVVENIETEAEAEDFVVENIETEAEADDFVEETVDAEAKEDILAEESADDNVSTAAEELEDAQKDDTPKVKAWSFLDDMVEVSTAAGVATAGVAGVTFVTKAMDEVVDEEVTDEDIEEVFVDFADSDLPQNVYKANLAEELFGADIVEKRDATEAVNSEKVAADAVEETVEAVAEAKDDLAEADNAETEEKTVTYDNNLEKILILPAQLNPMPLPEDTFIEGKTILGIGAERPLVLDNPVFSTGAYNMVQYIPNTGLTSEDYQQADAIEIVVGHGNGIEKNINSKEDLRQVVNFLRLESDGCPIGIKLGAARIERDLEFCIFAKPDYVVLNNFSVVPLPYALHRAMKFLNTVQSDIDIVIALDGVKDGEELAKIMAMGADVIALRNRPADMDGVIDELKKYARITGHYDVEDLNVKDLCTIDREIAEFTDIYHV